MLRQPPALGWPAADLSPGPTLLAPSRAADGQRQAADPGAGLADATCCSYICSLRFTWSERKRAANLKDHGLDFVDAPRVFEGLTYTYEDDRFAYGEQRFVTLGLLAGIPVSVVHTESEHEIRIVSFRKATKGEARFYFEQVQD